MAQEDKNKKKKEDESLLSPPTRPIASGGDFNISESMEEILSTPLDAIAPNIKKNILPMEQGSKIIETIAKTHNIENNVAFTAAALLFLKGAANAGTPPTLEVEVYCKKTNQHVSIRKNDIIYATNIVTGNTFIRRLAECFAVEIGKVAEKYGLKGDLATRIDIHLRSLGEKENPVLTAQELAWCSSFSQGLANLAELSGSERLPVLLAEDYTARFPKKPPVKGGQRPSKPPKSPKPKGGGKPGKDKDTN